MPVLCNCEATVHDLNRQTWSSQTSLVIHPADVYIGLRKLRNFVVKGDDMEIDVIATDIDGKVVKDKLIELTLKRKDQDKGIYVEVEKRKVVSGDKPIHVTFKPTSGGQHILAATAVDSKERPTETYVTAEIAEQEPIVGILRQPREMQLIADKDQYKKRRNCRDFSEDSRVSFSRHDGFAQSQHNIVSSCYADFGGNYTKGANYRRLLSWFECVCVCRW